MALAVRDTLSNISYRPLDVVTEAGHRYDITLGIPIAFTLPGGTSSKSAASLVGVNPIPDYSGGSKYAHNTIPEERQGGTHNGAQASTGHSLAPVDLAVPSALSGPMPTNMYGVPGQNTGPIKKRWALVIGISDYADDRIEDLPFAARDAAAFEQWLLSKRGGGYDRANVRCLQDANATGAAMREALFEWLAQPIEEDLVTIFFAGHGSSQSPDNTGNLFLLPHDADYDKVAASAFPMWDIHTAIRRFIKAKRIIVIADACHSGGIGREFSITRRAGRGMKVIPVANAFGDLARVSPGVIVLSASDATQLSREGSEWGGGHGVFTYFLLRGLAGAADQNRDAAVTVGELVPYLSEQVRRATRSAQSPKVSGDYDPAMTIAN